MKTGKQIVAEMMAEPVVFGGMLFTRSGLLKELRERRYTAEFIDYHVYAPGVIFNQNLEDVGNTEPNVVPAWFWLESKDPTPPKRRRTRHG